MRQVSWLAVATILSLSAPAMADQPVFVPQPPPPPSAPTSRARYAAPVIVPAPDQPVRKVRTIEVRVTAEGRTLIADRLRVREGQGASLSTNRSEATPRACKPSWQNTEATGVTLSIYAQNSSDDEPTYRFSFNWSRPGPDTDGCDSMGTQRVGIEQTISFAKSSRIVLRGDAGTMVELKLVEDGA